MEITIPILQRKLKESQGVPGRAAGDYQQLDLNQGLSDARVFALIMHSTRPRRNWGRGGQGWAVGGERHPRPDRCLPNANHVTPSRCLDQTQGSCHGLEALPAPDLSTLLPPSLTNFIFCHLSSLPVLQPHWSLLCPLTGMLLPQGLCTCCSICLELSAPRFPHGSLTHVI